jgi:hypothetical protein
MLTMNVRERLLDIYSKETDEREVKVILQKAN